MSRPSTPSEPAVKSRQNTGVARILTGCEAPVLQSRLAASATSHQAGGDDHRRRPSRRAQPDHRRPIADRDPCPRYVEKSQKALVRECTGGPYGEQHDPSPEVPTMPSPPLAITIVSSALDPSVDHPLEGGASV